ncbi:NUDIX hydrolase [Lysinibacter sp. HNR]|uniref:NUDIX hydrolase n=1 Tax=Lysinibacter sp. HNR TaxID=3031408 RepID=UPI002435D232|nr:NUDIX hydrolase [Lysinibacter sp. HNR]WGD38114.1 NUDIX hydrolase [Lysinibacter sp. HNR]
MTTDIYAAGAVCWRRVGDDIMVLLIHRTQHRDISFPKGKVDPGETLPQTAVREVKEETGISVSLGINLGVISYPLSKKHEKHVYYWAAEVTEKAVQRSTFTPNKEVDALIWTPLEEVRSELSYRQDKEIFDVFAKLFTRKAHDTFSVILLRHARAELQGTEFPIDSERPLSELGEAQAQEIVPTIAAFGRHKIRSSTALRCRQTVEPLSTYLDRKVVYSEDLSQEAWETGEFDLRPLIGTIVCKKKNVVVCSHGPVLPEVARELVLATGSLPGSYVAESTALPVSGFSIFHFSRNNPSAGILSIETYPRLLR